MAVVAVIAVMAVMAVVRPALGLLAVSVSSRVRLAVRGSGDLVAAFTFMSCVAPAVMWAQFDPPEYLYGQ